MFFMCIWGRGGGVFVLVWDAYWHLVDEMANLGIKRTVKYTCPIFNSRHRKFQAFWYFELLCTFP